MRGRMNEGQSYVPPFELGQPLDGGAVGEVVEGQRRCEFARYATRLTATAPKETALRTLAAQSSVNQMGEHWADNCFPGTTNAGRNHIHPKT